jgi:hypothetical protein
MADNKIEVIISAVDKASQNLESIRRQLDQLNSTMGTTASSAKSAADSLSAMAAAGQKIQTDFDRSRIAATALTSDVEKLSKVLQSVGASLPAEQIRKFLLDTSRSAGVSTQTVASIYGELAKRIGTFASQPQLQQLTQGILQTSRAFGTDLQRTTTSVTQVLSGFATQVQNTNVAIQQGLPLSQRAGALISAMGAGITTAGQAAANANAGFTNLGAGVVVLNQALELTHKLIGPLEHVFDEARAQAANYEEALTRASATLKVFGSSLPKKEIAAFAGELEVQLNVEEESILGVTTQLRSLTDLTDHDLKEATKQVILFARAFNQDTFTTAQRFASVLRGDSDALSRSIQIPKTIPADSRLEFIKKQYTQALEVVNAETAETIKQRTQSLTIAYDDLLKVLGKPVNDTFKAIAPEITKIVRAMESFVGQHQDFAGAVGVAVTALTGLAGVLTTIAALKITGIGAQLLELSKSLALFAATPQGLLLIGAAILATGTAFVKFQKDAHDAAIAKDPEELAKHIASIELAMSKVSEAEREKMKPRLEELKTQLMLSQRDAQDWADQFSDAGQKAANGLVPSQLSNKLREIGDTIAEQTANQAGEIKKAQAEVAAAGQQLIYETTGNIDALQRSFEIKRKAITDATKEDFDQRIRQIALQNRLRPEQIENDPNIGGKIRENLAAKEKVELDKADLEYQQKLFQIAQQRIQTQDALQSSIIAVQQSILDNDQQRLKVLQETNQPIEQQLALIGRIGRESEEVGKARIADLERQLKVQQDLATNGFQGRKLEGDELDKNLTKQKQITALLSSAREAQGQLGLATQKAILDALANSAKQAGTALEAQVTTLDSLRDLDQRRIDLANALAQADGKQRAPVAELYELAKRIDDTEEEILKKKIAQKENDLQTVRARNAIGLASDAELKLAEAQLDALKRQAEATTTEVTKLAQQLSQEARQAADQLANDLAEQVVQGLENGLQGGSKSLKDYFDKLLISLGRTLLTQGFAELLKKPFEAAAAQVQQPGEKVPTTTSGLIFATLKNAVSGTSLGQLFGLGKKTETPDASENIGERKPIGEAIARAGAIGTSPTFETAAAGVKTASDLLASSSRTYSDATAKFSDAVDKYSAGQAGRASPTSAPEVEASQAKINDLQQRLDAAIQQRNEVQRVTPQSDEEAQAQQATLRSLTNGIEALVSQKNQELANIGKTQPTALVEPRILEVDITSVSGQAAQALSGVNPSLENVQLGPSTDLSGLLGNVASAPIEAELATAAQSANSPLLPGPLSNVVGQANLNFSTIQGLLGAASGLAGGQRGGGIFGTLQGAVGAGQSLFSIYNAINGILNGGTAAAGTAASALGGGFAGGAAAFPNALGGLGIFEGAGAGAFEGASAAASSAADSLSFLDSFPLVAHEGGPINGWMRKHDGGDLRHDEVPIIGKVGEYMINEASARKLGKRTLDALNSVARYHDGGTLTALGGASSGGGMMLGSGTAEALTAAGGAKSGSVGSAPGRTGPDAMRPGIYGGGGAEVNPSPINQSLYLVDRRPQQLAPNDVVLILEHDIVNNGRCARAIQQLNKRH